MALAPLPHPDLIRQERARRSHEVLCQIDQPEWSWDKPHFKKLFEAFKALEPGQCLAIELPIRHGKSECITIRGAAHVMMQPGRRVLIAANTQDLAETFSRSIKEVLRRLGVKPGNKDGAKEWSTPWGSTLYAVGVGGAIEGRGFSDIFIDDPIASREDAESQTVRNKIWQWFTDSLWGRKEPGARVVFIMSRWHEDDPLGRIRKGAFHALLWTFLTITALAVEGDILGRQPGEPLWPERWSREHLESERQANERNFNARYQANPTSQEGDLFKPDRIGWCSRNDIGKDWKTVQAFDLGYSKSGDPTAWCQMWRSPDGRLYLDIDQIQEELDERNKWMNRKARQSGAKVLIPQDGGSGKDVVKQLTRLFIGLNVVSHTVTKKDGDKTLRASGYAAQVNAGNVMMVDSPVARQFLEQMRVFPNGAHDDMIDATADAFNDLADSYSGPVLIAL
jgi:predicted phage terminase large subunit-like protein